MRFSKAIIAMAILLCLPLTGPAESRDFVESYTYNAGEADSKLTCRTVSLLEVKRLLLERLGTYLETRTQVADFKITRDEIVALTAGVVKTEILDETWNGETYTLTAKIEADPDAVARAIDRLRQQLDDAGQVQKLAEVNAESMERIETLRSQLGQLQSNLLKVNQDMRAHTGLLDAWGIYEKGVRLRQSGQTEAAVAALTTAIEHNPTHLAYFERGMAHMELRKYDRAVADFTEALNKEPDMRGALFGRGKAYWKTGDKRRGKKDIVRAAELGNGNARRFIHKQKARGKF